MEKRIDLNSIPELIESKTISKEKAASLIAEDLVRNPKDYHLISNDEDILSELRLQILETSDIIFKNYRKEKCSFKTYITVILKYQILSIMREARRKNSGDEMAKAYPHIIYETQCEQYAADEAPFKIAHMRPLIKKTEDKIPYAERRLGKKKNSADSTAEPAEKPKIRMKDLVSYWTNRTSPKAKTALILALKSSYYITEENIESVCDYCEISKNLMKKTIEELKNSIPEKHEKLECLQNRRAKSFNFHIKLQKQMSEASDSEKKLEISKKYEYHTKKWNERNMRISKTGVKLSPTNKQLADLLGIGERQIGNYIKNAETVAEAIKEEIKSANENA